MHLDDPAMPATGSFAKHQRYSNPARACDRLHPHQGNACKPASSLHSPTAGQQLLHVQMFRHLQGEVMVEGAVAPHIHEVRQGAGTSPPGAPEPRPPWSFSRLSGAVVVL
jgi:hypothetical protein